MKKAIMIGTALVLLLFLLPSCAAGTVSQDEYHRVSDDLAAAQAQIQSLQDDLIAAQSQIQSLQNDLAEAQAQIQPSQDDKGVAEEKRAEALAYAEYMDIAMYPMWKDVALTPRFEFEDDLEWLMELKSRGDDMGDAELDNCFKALKEGDQAAMNLIWYHCLDEIEKTLK